MTSTQELEQYMNGLGQPPGYPGVPPAMSTDTPVAYYTPVAITPGTIKWLAGAIVSIIGFLATAPVAERYMMPAKQADLEILTKVVQVLQTGQNDGKLAMERVTLAIDNLAGIVANMKSAAAAPVVQPATVMQQEPAPVAPRPTVRRTRPPLPAPIARPTQ